MIHRRLTGEKRTYYKAGDIIYDLPAKLKYAKESERRRHTRFNGWGDLARLFQDENSR